MKARETDPRLRHQGCQRGDEIEWLEDNLRGARAGDTLFRAKPNRVGVAGVQFSEEIDFSIEYFLQRGE